MARESNRSRFRQRAAIRLPRTCRLHSGGHRHQYSPRPSADRRFVRIAGRSGTEIFRSRRPSRQWPAIAKRLRSFSNFPSISFLHRQYQLGKGDCASSRRESDAGPALIQRTTTPAMTLLFAQLYCAPIADVSSSVLSWVGNDRCWHVPDMVTVRVSRGAAERCLARGEKKR